MTRSPRVLPVLAGVMVMAALVLAASSTARAQVWASVHREPDRFVALAFTHGQLAEGCEAATDRQTFAVDLEAPAGDAMQVRFTVSAANEVVDESIVKATVPSGGSTVVEGDLEVPTTGAYQVEVGVVDHRERLLMRCRSEGSS